MHNYCQDTGVIAARSVGTNIIVIVDDTTAGTLSAEDWKRLNTSGAAVSARTAIPPSIAVDMAIMEQPPKKRGQYWKSRRFKFK